MYKYHGIICRETEAFKFIIIYEKAEVVGNTTAERYSTPFVPSIHLTVPVCRLLIQLKHARTGAL